MKSTFSPKHLGQFVRRTVVIIMYGVYVSLWLYWTWLPIGSSGARPSATPWVTLIGIVLFLAGFYFLYAATRRLADHWKPVNNQALDERQLLLRNRAYFWAYILLGLGVSIFLWNSVLKFGFFGVALTIVGLYGTLPTAMVAWLEPDPVPDEPIEHPLRQPEA